MAASISSVEVLFHESGTGYYDQGGNCYLHQFSPTDDYFEYTDLRENQFVADDDPRKQVRILQLGTMNN